MVYSWVLALAGMDCDGDGVPTADAGIDSASGAATCAGEMVGAFFNATIPFLLTGWRPPLFGVALLFVGIWRFALRGRR